MTDKKAIFIDIDGTLFSNGQKQVPVTSIKAIKALSTKPDIDLYIATGRPSTTLLQVEFLLPYFKGLNLANGQIIYIDNNLVYNGHFESNFVSRFLTYCEKFSYPAGILTVNELYMNFFDPYSRANFDDYCNTSIIDLNHQPFNKINEVCQFWAFVFPDKLNQLTSDFPDCTILSWGPYGADIIPPGCSKAQGIKRISQIMGYKKENMYAIGDGDNDIPMFEVVGTAIAMGNASDKVKEKANIITDYVDQDGFFKAMKKIKLL